MIEINDEYVLEAPDKVLKDLDLYPSPKVVQYVDFDLISLQMVTLIRLQMFTLIRLQMFTLIRLQMVN